MNLAVSETSLKMCVFMSMHLSYIIIMKTILMYSLKFIECS